MYVSKLLCNGSGRQWLFKEFIINFRKNVRAYQVTLVTFVTLVNTCEHLHIPTETTAYPLMLLT